MKIVKFKIFSSKLYIDFFIVSLLILALIVPSAGSATTHSENISAEQKKLIENIIQDYLLKNPEVIIQSIREMEARDRIAKARKVTDTLARRKADLENDPASHVGGNPNGNITLVEFFDYQCGYCKQVFPTIRKLLKDDGNIRFVYKEFPILGPNSVYASRATIAARTQGKYAEFHDALMELKGPLSQARVLKTASIIGLDVDKLVKEIEMNKSTSDRIMKLNYDLADDLNINGTPAFIIGGSVIRGAADLASLKSAIANGRKEKKAQGG